MQVHFQAQALQGLLERRTLGCIEFPFPIHGQDLKNNCLSYELITTHASR